MPATRQAVGIDCNVQRDGHVTIDREKYQVGAGTRVTMRLDGHLMHMFADGAPARTWPCPITAECAQMNGARAAAALLPAGSITAAASALAAGFWSKGSP